MTDKFPDLGSAIRESLELFEAMQGTYETEHHGYARLVHAESKEPLCGRIVDVRCTITVSAKGFNIRLAPADVSENVLFDPSDATEPTQVRVALLDTDGGDIVYTFSEIYHVIPGSFWHLVDKPAQT